MSRMFLREPSIEAERVFTSKNERLMITFEFKDCERLVECKDEVKDYSAECSVVEN